MANSGPIEQALTKLQAAIRGGQTEVDRYHGRSQRIPEDLATEQAKMLTINARDEALLAEVVALLLADQRFEHLEPRGAEKAVWRFICLAYMQRATNHVGAFTGEHAREPSAHTLYIPVESLEITEPSALGDVRLMPVDDPEVADGRLGFPIEPPIGAVVAVPVAGTLPARMTERGREAALQALRVLRVGLREHQTIHDRQLRFRLSHLISFDSGLPGFRIQPDAAWNLPLSAEDVELVERQPLAALYNQPANKLERQAQLALRWIERGLVAPDETDQLLYLFMGLEALLGDRQEGLKAPALAFRRAMLSAITRGSFADPGRVFGLYGEVRSMAVHGEELKVEVPPNELTAFAWDTRRALNEYLRYGAEIGATKRSTLTKALHEHEQAADLIAWLREHGDRSWSKYLDKLESPPA